MSNDVIEMESGRGAVAASQERALAPAPQAQATPADIVLYAMKNGGSIAEIREFMQLQREWEADQARKAFLDATAAFMAEAITVHKDKENLQYKSTYTSLGNLVNTVRPYLSKHRLSANWKIDQSDGLVVTCILSHSLGHTDQVTFKVPPDTAGAKNAIQQLKSAITYAKGVTFESVCGLASSDANSDDDGSDTGPAAFDTRLADEWIAKVKAAPNDAAVVNVWNVGAEIIEAKRDRQALAEFRKAVAERRAEFEKVES